MRWRRIISKFAELVRPSVTYGRLTDYITCAHSLIYKAPAAVCELAKAPDIDIEERDLAASLRFTPTPADLQILVKRMAFFARTGETGSVLWERAGSRARDPFTITERKRVWMKKIENQGRTTKAGRCSLDSELCNEIANSPHMLREFKMDTKWEQNQRKQLS